jgi:large subunit ribosomal protein L30
MAEDKIPEFKVAAVLIRGKIGLTVGMKDTLDRLNLFHKHNCVLLPNTPIVEGMLRKVKDVITWGPVSEEVAEKVKARNTVKSKDVKFKSYKLSPPRGGFERKGIKKSFTVGGVLGKRETMDDLLSKMV